MAIPNTFVVQFGQSHTSDLGHYRLYGLQPGQYVISVMPATAGTNRLPGYPLAYYPGTPALAEAQLVVVEIGGNLYKNGFGLGPG